MKKIKLFLGAYINAQNAQNINCLALAQYIDKEKFEIYTMEHTKGNINIDFLRSSCKIIFYNSKFKFTKIWIYIYALYTCDVLYLPKQEKLSFITLLNKLFFKKAIFLTIESILDEYTISKISKNTKKGFNKYKRSIESVEYVYSISKFIREYNLAKVGLYSEERILSLGVDNENFVQKNKLSNNLKNIIFIGNDMKRKGIDEYLELALNFPDLVFHIVGKGSEIDFKEIQKKYSNVVYHGSISPKDLNGILQEMDLHVLPSKSEGFPKVILETAMVGVPSLVYSHYGASEWLRTEYNGFVVDNFKSFQEVIMKLKNDNDLLRFNAKNAIKLSQRFHWSLVVKDWEDEITKLYTKKIHG